LWKNYHREVHSKMMSVRAEIIQRLYAKQIEGEFEDGLLDG
jgi:hypothetical protein